MKRPHRVSAAALLLPLLLLLCVALGTSRARGGGLYTFTTIAQTGPRYAFLDGPALNNHGDVAFTATPPTHPLVRPYAVYIRKGVTTTTHYPFGSGMVILSTEVSFNDSGSFLFSGLTQSAAGIVRASADGNGSFVWQYLGGHSYYDRSINAADQVLVNVLGPTELMVVYRVERDGTVNPMIDSSGPYRFFASPVLDDRGTVYTGVETDAGGGLLIRARGGGEPAQVLYSSAGRLDAFGPLDANNDGTVAFVARRDDGTRALFRGDGGRPELIADLAGAYADFRTVQINADGHVMFMASLSGGGSDVFFGPDPLAHRVLATGDALLGSVVTNVGFFEGFNDAGQVALLARLADGSSAIVRAEPVPEPAGPASLLALTICALRRYRRMR
jgi:hypothetical protein